MAVASDAELASAVERSFSYADVARALGRKPGTGNQSNIKRRVQRLGLDTSHFTGQAWRRGKTFNTERRSVQDILTLWPEGSPRPKAYQLRRALVECGAESACVMCGNKGLWNDGPLVLEIDHINGNWLDNRIENLRFLCPNCHAQVTVRPKKVRTNSCIDCGVPIHDRSKRCAQHAAELNARKRKESNAGV